MRMNTLNIIIHFIQGQGLLTILSLLRYTFFVLLIPLCLRQNTSTVRAQTMHIRTTAGSMDWRWVAVMVAISLAVANIISKSELLANSNEIVQQQTSTKRRKINKETKESKPLLVLHVGPPKSGTTTIQLNLANQRTANTLLADNYTIVRFNYKQFSKLVAECFRREKDCKENGRWKKLRNLYNASTVTTNAIHSTESFSGVPSDPHTTQRFQSLLDNFRIQVIVVYRRAHEWLPSAYHQHEKYKIFIPQKRFWKGFHRDGPQRTSFVDFFKDMFPRMGGDSYHVHNLYTGFFGKDAVTVIPMPSDGSLLSQFYCHGLPNANHTCDMIKKLEKKKGKRVANPSGQFLFDHDLLLEHALDLIPDSFKENRHGATVALEERLAQLNLTIRDMPQQCLSPQQEDALWNYTIMVEQEIAPNPMDHSELKKMFQDSMYKFCGVDVMTTLRNETWREVISSIGKSSSAM